jgi:hypothetical protein
VAESFFPGVLPRSGLILLRKLLSGSEDLPRPDGRNRPSNRAPEAEPEERSDIMAKSTDTKKESKKKPTKTQKEKKAAKKSKKETQGS